jgi:uncharacterized protein GlcG (DUF336 family)
MRYSTHVPVVIKLAQAAWQIRRRVSPVLVWLGWLALAAAAAVLGSCGGSGTGATTGPPPVVNITPLTQAEVDEIVQSAAGAVNVPLVIAVVDRGGNILAVYSKQGAPALAHGNFLEEPTAPASVGPQDPREVAVAVARTAAFFSNDQAPLSSRTVRFISGIHFPPGVSFTANADLYGIENTNRGCSFDATYLPGKQLNPATALDGVSPSLGIVTGKSKFDDSNPGAVNPGGVPLFRRDPATQKLLGVVGGIGVVASDADLALGGPVAEFAAVVGAADGGSPLPKFLPTFPELPPPGIVIVGGIALPFVNQTTQPAGTNPETPVGAYSIIPSAGLSAPEGDLIQTTGGAGGLTQSDVAQILQQAVDAANKTRAVIRLPNGMRTKMSIAVSDLDGTLLGLNRMHDGTVFSVDVAVAKSRNVIWYSTGGNVDLPGIPSGTAVTNRTISFGAQPFFPPGIDGTGPGPFYPLYLFDTANPCTQGSQPAPPNPGAAPHRNGIVFFPGSLPLYKNGVLVGGLGVSGDGVDQDDFVTFNGAQGFQPPDNLHADNVIINGVRMPYLKFPRNPTD